MYNLSFQIALIWLSFALEFTTVITIYSKLTTI